MKFTQRLFLLISFIFILTSFVNTNSKQKNNDGACFCIVNDVNKKIKLWEDWGSINKKNTALTAEQLQDLEIKYEIAMEEVVKYSKALSKAFPNTNAIENIKIDDEKIKGYTTLSDSLIYGAIDNESADVTGLAARREKAELKINVYYLTDIVGECYKFIANSKPKKFNNIKKALNNIKYKPFKDL